MRGALNPLAPSPLRALFAKLFNKLSEADVINEYERWKSHVIVSFDGVEHFSSTKVHCDHCTTRTRRDGETSYHHAGLAAMLIHPDQEEVFTLDFEPILNADGARKNDCERNAAKRLGRVLAATRIQVQMIQRYWRLFHQVRGGLRTKAKLWESVRSLFKVQLFPMLDALYRQIAELYDLQLC
jgi:hypothetical protein